MKCYKCKIELRKIDTNYIRKTDERIAIIENTPTYLCENCYEQYYTEEVICNIEKIMEKIEELPIKVAIIEYSNLKNK